MKNYSDLPEPIIHIILSSLTEKEAAQTTLVSKSWATAWSTRPTIDLDEDRVQILDLAVIANKTFSRYEESNLTIHTFRLCLKSQCHVTPGLAAKWISKALELGASDITLRHECQNIGIPIDEVLESENVVRFCLTNLRFDLPEVIKCSGLKSLALTQVDLSFDSFRRIISCCPSIEELSLRSPFYGGFRFSRDHDATMISLHKLTSLDLCHVELDLLQTLFLRDLSSMFPILKDLTITSNECVFRIPLISSSSLEIFNFRLSSGGGGFFFHPRDYLRRVELDLPSIRKFTFEGLKIPDVSFRSTTGDQWEWDSHLSISHTGHPSSMISWVNS